MHDDEYGALKIFILKIWVNVEASRLAVAFMRSNEFVPHKKVSLIRIKCRFDVLARHVNEAI